MPLVEEAWAKTRVEAGGRIVIPASFRKQSGIKPGDVLVLEWTEPGTLTVLTYDVVGRRVQDSVKSYPRGESSPVDELIEERRQEAARE